MNERTLEACECLEAWFGPLNGNCEGIKWLGNKVIGNQRLSESPLIIDSFEVAVGTPSSEQRA